MRELKFRAWDTHNKLMFDAIVLDLRRYNKEQYEIMQFTGLKDKNGREIFEGDVVRTKWGGLGAVEFVDGSFHFMFENSHVKRQVNEHEANERETEVIGNIYENPDLL